MDVSDVHRFRTAERASWPLARAGTAAPSGWILDPKLTLTRQQNDRLGVPTHEASQRKGGK
eukprot:5793189-Alexandrium_andersonii.AAC.1